MRACFTVILMGLAAGFGAGCGSEPAVAEADEREAALAVWVTVAPQAYIVEKILGEQGTVTVMVRSGQSPETYAPTVQQMSALSKADLYFGLGMPLESMILSKVKDSMPTLRFIETAPIIEHDPNHVHGPECLHGEEDPHLWVDPIWMASFAEKVRDALIEAQPESADVFEANADALIAELLDLDKQIAGLLKPYAGRSFYINHPSLWHFAERYGIEQRSIEIAGSAPSARQVAELVEQAKAEGVGSVFTQPEFGRSSAEVLARALDVETVEMDVLNADYANNLLEMTHRIVDSFGE